MPEFTIGNYLATRLEQIGIKHYFMVPGDYNLVLLDQLLANKNMEQIGCCNELNASYAAEAYARVNGCGAVVATMNVGSFSALNGVAGAYAERLPVIFVASGYNTNDASASHLLHHSLGTHDFSYQYEMFKYVTCAAVRIVHPDDAPSMIDHAIRTALRERKPAYIEIACNLSDAPCPKPGPYEAIMAPEESNSDALAGAVDRATALLASAKKPILLAGAHLRCSHGAIGAFRDVAEALGCAVAVMPDAKGFFPEDHPQYIGIYWGPVSSPGCEAVLDWADVIVAAGPVFSDYTTAGWTGEPPAEKMINVSARDVRFADAEYTNVALADFLAGLARNVHGNDATLTQFHRIATAPAELAARNGDASAQLTRAELWHQIEQDLDPKSTLLCEGGDSWFNGAFTRLPGGARFEIEMQWGSLGWACPATFGYAMGLEADRRLVSVIGDGSFQLTAQEVANMIRHGQETVIFLVNNRGYVSESAIHDGPYNYFKNWDYAGLIDAWNADDGHGLGLTATTGEELAGAISKSTQAQRRPRADRMPDRARRLQSPAHRMGRKSRPRQHPPAPDHLIHNVMSPGSRTQRGGSRLADCNSTGHNSVPAPCALRQASRGLRLDLYLLHHDEISAACLAVITASRIPIRAAGLGAAPTALDAMRKATAEVVQVRRALSLRLDDPAVLSRARDLARSAAQAETMEDHGLLYAASESTGSFDFLENQPYTRWTDLDGPPAHDGGSADDVGQACEGLANYIARRAPSPCFVDVTTPDVRTFELEVVRVIAPGLATPHWGLRSQALINARIGLHHLGNNDPHPLVGRSRRWPSPE